ncbi:MAG: hypothetical protein QNK05_20120, partial [Myxococcota bacterium]|nr:hypothetical protein [Myxococcota bacterium]
MTLQSDATGAARLARQVSDFADLIVEEQAQAEFADAVSSAEIATREYLARSKGIRINSDTGRPAFETAEQDFESFYSDLETSVAKNLTSNRARDRVSEQLKLMRENAQADVRSIARGHQIDDIVTRTSASVDRYVAAGEYDAARLALQNQKAHFSPQNMQRISDYIDSAQSGALHDQAINDVMAQHAEAMRQGQSAEFIRNFRASNHFEDEETRKLASKMLAQNREYQAEQDELDTEFKAQEARALQARLYVVDERIDRGDPSVMGDIEEMLAAGDITAATASDKRRRLERALEDNRAVTDGYAILSAGGILDPKNKHHRRLVDNELAVIVQEGGGIDQPETRS